MKPRLALLALACLAPFARAGRPFHDTVRDGAPQPIPGIVFCAYYDEGGEGVAYHDHDAENQGSGKLNPADGTYLNEFRRHEGVDISYTKPIPDRESPCNRVVPPLGLLYVGWNDPGDWFNVTVATASAGDYTADVLYTAHNDARVSISVNGGPPASLAIASTFDPAETIPWRQWHHWNVARDAFTLSLPQGASTLTVRIESGGNLNLATLVFRPAGGARTGPDPLDAVTPTPTQLAVAAALRAWADAFNRRDPEKLLPLYAPDAVFWGTTSPTLRDTPAAIREYFSNMGANPQTRVTLGESRIRAFGDLAIATGAYVFTGVRDGQPTATPARFTFVFRREDGRWPIVEHHSSAVPPPRK